MIFRFLFRDLLGRMGEWDAASRISFLVASTLLIFLLLLGFFGPQAIRFPARIGAFGLLLTLQLVIFWGNRRLISPYLQAQQHFLAGDYSSARDTLEQIPESDRTSVDALVLLGNCYRHLGQFARSKHAIEHALQLKPDYHYALYALGKLNLVTAAYHEASDAFEQALASGAPDLVQFDMGQANFLLGNSETATKHLGRFCSRATDEPEKLMLATYLLHIMGSGEHPSAAEIHEHISYWREEALKYAATDFGKALQSQVDELSTKILQV